MLLNNWYNERESDEESERNRIVRTAAEIIREDIRAKIYCVTEYSSPSILLSSSTSEIPATLLSFLKEIISKNKKNPENYDNKCITIAHSIIASARPRTFKSSLLTG